MTYTFRFSPLRCLGIFTASVIAACSVSNSGDEPKAPVGATKNEVVIGDFGGMRVEIPAYYVSLIEYDDDPGLGLPRKGPRPTRTSESRIRSFSLDVRYPDMQGLVNQQIREEKRRQPLSEYNWLNAAVVSGEFYPGDDFLQKRTRHLQGDVFDQGQGEFKGHWNYLYRRQAAQQFDLDVFLLSGTDPRTGKPASLSEDTYDIYIHRDSSKKVDVFIQCNRTYVPGGIAMCHMEFSLAPKAHVKVDVGFRHGLLSEWNSIHQSVQRLLLGFETGKQ